MLVAELIEELGYADSPYFLKKGTRQFATAPNVGHILRTAAKSKCSLLGVYAIEDADNPVSTTPVVYVCKATTEAAADEVHRLVWNQDITPYVIVYTPKGVKFYSGFEYSGQGDGHLSKLLSFNAASSVTKRFHADEINSGRLWRSASKSLKPERRVNWRLLDNLRHLDKHLQNQHGLPATISHALIGKYVYLSYLRDRGILSQRKLESWGVVADEIFGATASVSKLKLVVSKLEGWLNGKIFPLSFNGPKAPKSEHVKIIAGVFNGDDVLPSGERQLSLDFQAYDFSFIPIETLSVVYEQFLHTPDEDGNSKGKDEGAYYTPIPVVNYMLGEMEQARPLEDGVRVIDPACGSGAFLVQCYRRLIEKAFPQHRQKTVHPVELRMLLVDNIFGIDRDPDACAVTELSLLLTLLDYVDPPDLEDDKRVKLPTLRGKNIFRSDFFDPIPQPVAKKPFGWIVGNPPWKKLNPRKLKENDKPAWKWMQDNKKDRPVGGNELARAFAWRVAELGDTDSEIGLFLPAMTLFDQRAIDFRQKFFRAVSFRSVANFSNLAEVISAGRFRVPSASFFYTFRDDGSSEEIDGQTVRVFSPLVANQEITRPDGEGERIESWCIVINESEVRDLEYSDITDGSGLPWKIAAWGSHDDVKLLRRLSHHHATLDDLQNRDLLTISQGPDLRSKVTMSGEDKTEYCQELVGAEELDTWALAGLRHLFQLPKNAYRPCDRHHLRLRAGRRTLSVCRGPHVVVSAARNFAIYEEDYLVVPSRQIGIVSPQDDRDLLKALSLFLSSDFALYHQLFTSTEFGVKRDRATLEALKQMPCPLSELSRSELKPWVSLHKKLIKTTPRRVGSKESEAPTLFNENDPLDELLVELNDLVSDSLNLTNRDRALISDFVNVRLELNDGKVGRPAIERPSAPELRAYATRLRKELDDFLGIASDYRHSVEAIHEAESGMVCVDFVKSKKAIPVSVMGANRATAAALAETRQELQHETGQWVYFNRDLRLYDGMKTYLFKPMQRFHWTESQAMIDASEIIAETVSDQGVVE
ncbi:MAG: N-6 DNA methylase [Fuerstiella sp.]